MDFKRILAFGDIHGFYDYFMQALESAKYDPSSDLLISCGDLLDRGKKPVECLSFVCDKIKDDKIVCIRGNHEDLTQEAIARREFLGHDLHNGTAETLYTIYEHWPKRRIPATNDDVFEYIKENGMFNRYMNYLVDYYEYGDYIFVHGWVPCKSGYKFDKNGSGDKIYTLDPGWEAGDWSKARWINGMDAWNQGAKIDGKTIVCGHWNSSWGAHYIDHNGPEFNNRYSTNPEHRCGAHFEPFIKPGIIALDGCTAYSHRVNIVAIEGDEIKTFSNKTVEF